MRDALSAHTLCIVDDFVACFRIRCRICKLYDARYGRAWRQTWQTSGGVRSLRFVPLPRTSMLESRLVGC